MRKLAILVCLSMAAAGCGGDEPAATTAPPVASPTTGTDPYVPPEPPPATTAPTTVPTTTAAPATTAAPGGTPAAADPIITIAGFAFSGPSTVAVGDTVEVVNNDGVPHTWTSEESGAFNLSLAAGSSGTYTFEEPGEYQFFCTIHPSMTGTITVEG